MILFRIALGLSLGVSFSCAIAAEDVISPGANLIVDGIPPLPAALAGRIAAYTEFRGQRFVGWHPSRREMLIARRAEATTQIFELSAPGAIPRQLTRFSEPVGDRKSVV